MRGVLLGIIIGVILISACTPAQPQEKEEEIICEKPMTRSGSGCCLDENDNFICDKDEFIEKEEKEEKSQETPLIKVGGKFRISEENLPLTVHMQRETRIIYTIDGEEEIMILRDLDKSHITMHYIQDRFRIDTGRKLPVGSLLIKYLGTDPPKGGNAAVLELEAYYQP